MIKNYFKIAWRNLNRNKGYSAINIGGLAVGMAVAVLIGLWVYDELSYNKYHKNYDRLAIVKIATTDPGTKQTKDRLTVWLPLGDILKNQYGQYFEHVAAYWYIGSYTLRSNNQNFTKTGNFIGEEVLEMLSLTMMKGSYKSLSDPNSIVLSESAAKAIFGDKNPVNEPIKINNRMDAKVAGVYKDIPKNSDYGELDFIASFALWQNSNDWSKNAGWHSPAFNFLVQRASNVTQAQADAVIRDILVKNSPEDFAKETKKYNPVTYLYPMKDWHLYSEFKNGYPAGGRITFVWLFGIIGVFVLILACINFMNLSTARSEKRAKEVGIRKTIGSLRTQLVKQFLSESFLIVLLAFVIAALLVFLSLSWFNQLADKNIHLPLSNPVFWLMILAFILITGFMAGIYPAFYLSSFAPVKVLKGFSVSGKMASLSRKTLVVFQFTVSVILIIGTVVVYKQIMYAQNRPAGYDRSGLVQMFTNDPNYAGKHELLRNELLHSGMVSNVAYSFSPITSVWNNSGGFSWQGMNPETDPVFDMCSIDYDYGSTVNWEIVEGRDFSRSYGMDSSALIINEAAAKYMGVKNPIGMEIRNERDPRPFIVIGVVKDVIMLSPYEPVKQTFFTLDNKKTAVNLVYFRIKPGVSASRALPAIESVFKKVVPSAAFDYRFVDDEYGKKFSEEQRIGKLASVFAILAIFISCLGLFGLASFIAAQRTKEIGVRKILGASVGDLWQMLSKDFVKLVIISCIIAIPVAYYYMNAWLQNYQYRTTVSWWVFTSAVAGALLITILTVSFQAIKAAIANPVKSLRTE